MFTPEQHFVWAVDRLFEIHGQPTDQRLIEASGILRRLLLDQDPLLSQANKPRKARIRFPLLDIATDLENDPIMTEGTMMLSSLQGFAPEPGVNWKYVKLLTLDEFLAVKKTFLMGKFLSVRDIIDHLANNAGGVHLSEPRTETQKDVRDLYEGFIVNNGPALLSDIHSITNAVLQGVAVLYHRITEPPA